jgi:hypothetical protein
MNVVRKSITPFDADKLFTSSTRASIGGSIAQSLAVDSEGMNQPALKAFELRSIFLL